MMALPSVDEAENQGLISSQDEVALSLYSEVVLPAEKAATEASNSDNAVASRIIGYLLLYPPSDDARATLKSEIELCKDESDVDQNEAVYDLGDTYFKYFIQVFCESDFECYISEHDTRNPDSYHTVRTGTREPSTPDSEGWDESSKSPNCYALLMAHIPGRSDATLCARDHAHAKAAVRHPYTPTSALITGLVSKYRTGSRTGQFQVPAVGQTRCAIVLEKIHYGSATRQAVREDGLLLYLP